MRVWLIGLLILVSPLCSAANDVLLPTELVGIWKGTISTPTVPIHLFWRIDCEDDGSLIVTYDSPLYGIKDVPVPQVTLTEDTLDMRVSMFASSFIGRAGPIPDTLLGRFQADGGPIPLILTRVAADPSTLLPYMVPRLSPAGRPHLSYDYASPESRPGGWPVAEAASVGLQQDQLELLVRRVLAGKYPNLHSLLIVKDNQLVFEEYFYGYDADKPHPIYSNTKGLYASLVGIAIDQGLVLGVDQKLSMFFPEYADLWLEPGKSDLTLNHCLDMTAGFQWDETSTSYYDEQNSNRRMQHSPSQVDYVLNLPLVHTPGQKFTYNSGLPCVLSEVVARCTGQYPWLYAEAQLFKPLGMHNYFWESNADGTSGSLLLRPRDFIKVGQLYLDRGRWQSQQVIPATWFDNCYKDNRECDGPEYWNHWGRSRVSVAGKSITKYSGGGFGGQAIHGFPELGLVVAMTAGNYFTMAVDQDQIMNLYILPALMADYMPPVLTKTEDRVILPDLQWQDLTLSKLSALSSALTYLDESVSESWLYGITGYAFLFNTNSRLDSSCLGRWSNERFDTLTQGAGYKINTYACHQSQPAFEATRAAAWDSVRAALDHGRPAYGFHLDIPETYVIYGYDRLGYYFKGRANPAGQGPKCWQQVASEAPGWFEMQTVDLCDAQPRSETVLAALAWAVELNTSGDTYSHWGFTMGAEAYGHWQAALTTGDGDWFGTAYTASLWAACRRNAVGFLTEARHILPAESHGDLQTAQDHYQIVADCWRQISALFPFDGTERWQRLEHWEDAGRRKQALALINQAKESEALAVAALAELVETRSP